MALLDGIVVLLILMGFGFLIWGRLVRKKHPIVEKSKEWLSDSKKKKLESLSSEKWQQVYPEKRQIM